MVQILVILMAKLRMARHAIGSVRTESKLKIGVISIFAVALWFTAFLFFYWGFHQMISFGDSLGGSGRGIGAIIMARLLGVLALVVFFMLLFSNILVSFSTLYRAHEVPYLLLAPMRFRAYFVARFFEIVTFSSWALAYLGSPLILAYGLSTSAPLAFYVAAVLFFIPFVALPAAFGSVITMLLVRIFPRLRMWMVVILAVGVILMLFPYWRQTLSANRLSEDSILPALLDVTGQVQSPLLPSHWASRGVLAAAESSYRECAFNFLLLLSNAMMALLIAAYFADHIFYIGWSSLCGQDRTRVRPLGRGVMAWMEYALRIVPNPARALAVKDIKLFWREPTQWSQFIIFFGIMGIYMANLRNAGAHYQQDFWRSWVACLNIGASTLILATLTTRFVYPLVSLEGRRFWIVGLAPLTFHSVVWQKFWLSLTITMSFTVLLAVLNGYMLSLEPVYFLLTVYSVIVTNFSLTGLAVGLGSLYPNFDEDNPARIVSGMGGTLNLLLSVAYLVVIVGIQTLILQWRVLKLFPSAGAFYTALAVGVLFITLLSAACTFVPMRLGLRNLRKMEY